MKGLYFSGGNLRFHVDDEDGERRLRDALGQLLQVNQVVVLMGTGASFHLGAPSIRDVDLNTLKSLCEAAGTTLSEDQLAVLDPLVGDGTDLESLLGQLNSAVAYADAFKLTSVPLLGTEVACAAVRECFAAVNVGLAAACDLPRGETDESHSLDPWLTHREFFRRLFGARRPDAPRVRLFTTNYDTVLERALDDSGVLYIDGFVGGIRRTFNLTSYSNDVFTSRGSNRRALHRVRDLVLLYKLHGSLTWRAEAPAEGLGTSTIVQAPGAPKAGELAVIYPTPAKDADVLGHPYADLLREFGAAIASPECALVVIGYGFVDDHINRLIHQALALNSTLQLLVADPLGVVPEGAEVTNGEVERSDTAVGRLSRVPDPRISIVSGEVAKFTRFATALPDIGERSIEQQQSLDSSVLEALLAPHSATETDEAEEG